MKPVFKMLSAASALALATFAVPATATVFVVTYSGTIYDGVDDTGVFGPAGSSLFHAHASLAFTFDTATPGATYQADPNVPATYAKLFGSGLASPGSVVVTVNGISFAIDGSSSSLAEQYNAWFGTTDIIHHEAADSARDSGTGFYLENNAQADITSDTRSIVSSVNLTGPFSFTPRPALGDTANGRFHILDGYSNNQTADHEAYGYFDVSSLTIAPYTGGGGGGSAEPEPASWIMMIAGLGFTGLAMRRRRPRTAFA
jgi:hypothetical protein